MNTTKEITKSLAQIANGFESLARTVGREGAKHIVKHIHLDEAAAKIKNKISSYIGHDVGNGLALNRRAAGGDGVGNGLALSKRGRGRRKMSAAARAKIAAAQKKRWAAFHAKKAGK
jgi:hypothetical protein